MYKKQKNQLLLASTRNILTMLPRNLVEKTNMVCTCRSGEALGYQVHLLRSMCVLWSIPKSEYFANTIHV